MLSLRNKLLYSYNRYDYCFTIVRPVATVTAIVQRLNSISSQLKKNPSRPSPDGFPNPHFPAKVAFRNASFLTDLRYAVNATKIRIASQECFLRIPHRWRTIWLATLYDVLRGGSRARWHGTNLVKDLLRPAHLRYLTTDRYYGGTWVKYCMWSQRGSSRYFKTLQRRRQKESAHFSVGRPIKVSGFFCRCLRTK